MGECVQSHSLGPWAPSILTSEELVKKKKAKDEFGFLERSHSLEITSDLEECLL